MFSLNRSPLLQTSLFLCVSTQSLCAENLVFLEEVLQSELAATPHKDNEETATIALSAQTLNEAILLDSIADLEKRIDTFFASRQVFRVSDWENIIQQLKSLKDIRGLYPSVDEAIELLLIQNLSRANEGYYLHEEALASVGGIRDNARDANIKGPKAFNAHILKELKATTINSEAQQQLVKRANQFFTDGLSFSMIIKLQEIVEVLAPYDNPDITALHSRIQLIGDHFFQNDKMGRDVNTWEFGWLYHDEANRLGPIALKQKAAEIEQARQQMRNRIANKIARDDDQNIRELIAAFAKSRTPEEQRFMTKVTFHEILNTSEDARCERIICIDFEAGTAELTFHRPGHEPSTQILPLSDLLNDGAER